MEDQHPPIRYAHGSDDARIAFMRLGKGDPFIIEVPHIQMCHLELEWQLPAVRRWCTGITRRHTLVRFDNRGSGLSRDQVGDFSLGSIADDIGYVADSLGRQRFALFGRITGGLPAVMFAALHPARVSHLILWNGFASHQSHGGHSRMKAILDLASADWELFTESISQAALGWQDSAAARAWAGVLRQATTQNAFLRYLNARTQWDVGPLLGSIRAKALILHDQNNQLASAERSQELAAAIPDAELATVTSMGGMPGADAIEVIEHFLTIDPPETLSVPSLTARENEVMTLVITGASNQSIADELGISINTVNRHLTHIFGKLGVSNRAQAISFVLSRVAGSG